MNAPEPAIAVTTLTPDYAAPTNTLERVPFADITVGKIYFLAEYVQRGNPPISPRIQYTNWNIIRVTGKEAGNTIKFKYVKDSRPGSDPVEWVDSTWFRESEQIVYGGALPPPLASSGLILRYAVFSLAPTGGSRRHRSRRNKRRGTRRRHRRV